MLRRLSREVMETLAFRGTVALIAIAIVLAAIAYYALFARHLPREDARGLPSVPAGQQPPAGGL